MTALSALLLAVAMIAAPAVPVAADQNDPRLDALFAALEAPGTSEADAAGITQEIWNIWRRIDDEKANVFMARGITAMHLRRYRQALEDFDRVVREAPQYAEGWNKRATVLYLMDDYKASIRDIGRTLKLEPRHFGALSGLGLCYRALGEDGKALDAFRRALAINPFLDDARAQVKELEKELRGQRI